MLQPLALIVQTETIDLSMCSLVRRVDPLFGRKIYSGRSCGYASSLDYALCIGEENYAGFWFHSFPSGFPPPPPLSLFSIFYTPPAFFLSPPPHRQKFLGTNVRGNSRLCAPPLTPISLCVALLVPFAHSYSIPAPFLFPETRQSAANQPNPDVRGA